MHVCASELRQAMDGLCCHICRFLGWTGQQAHTGLRVAVDAGAGLDLGSARVHKWVGAGKNEYQK